MSNPIRNSILLILIFLVSCSKPPPPRLTKIMKKEVDSLYLRGLDSIKKEIELKCDEAFNLVYQNAIDSFQNLRKEEIESILSQ